MFSLISRLNGVVAPLVRGMTLGVRGACIDAEGRLFLVRHSYMPGWYMPGGGVERGESAVAALTRELVEEGGIVLGGPPTLFGIYWNRRRPRDHVLLYVVRGFKLQIPPPYPNREIVEAGFFPLAALPAEVTAATTRRIAEIFDGRPPADTW